MDVERSEKIKKTRRKIEEKLRKEFSDEKIEALATLLDVNLSKLPVAEEEPLFFKKNEKL
jgi:hypothetical protein